MYTRAHRPLADDERRLLRRRLDRLSTEATRKLRRVLWATGLVFVPLWGATIAAAKQVVVPSVVWAALAVGIGAWSALDVRREQRAARARLEGALIEDHVEEVRVTSTEMVELEEIEDLGACYAFQVEPDRILFVQGQEYYANGRFPSTDFAIATVFGSRGDAVERWVRAHGERLRPTRVVSVEEQKGLRLPDDLELMPGRLSDLPLALELAPPA